MICVYSSRGGLTPGQKTMFSDNVKWKVENGKCFPTSIYFTFYIVHFPLPSLVSAGLDDGGEKLFQLSTVGEHGFGFFVRQIVGGG